MASLVVTRAFDAPLDRVWDVLGHPEASPGSGVEVEIVRPASADDGTGLVRTVRPGKGAFQEEITAVDAPHRLEYRLLKGAPVRDYTGVVTLDGLSDGKTQVDWAISFRPVVPGTGWLISRATSRTIRRVLDIVGATLEEGR